MIYEITAEPGYLKATLFGRETGEETREFIGILARENKRHNRSAILLDVRLSRPIFHIDPNGFFEDLKKLAAESSCRIALLGDTPELRLSHEYLSLLARQQGLNVWSFRFEATALKWLTEQPQLRERRDRRERRQRIEQRQLPEYRRQRERRAGSLNPQPAF